NRLAADGPSPGGNPMKEEVDGSARHGVRNHPTHRSNRPGHDLREITATSVPRPAGSNPCSRRLPPVSAPNGSLAGPDLAGQADHHLQLGALVRWGDWVGDRDRRE